MKYIRTKDGRIIDFTRLFIAITGKPCANGTVALLTDSPIIRQSNDVEELCDEFVAFKHKADGYDWGILNAKDYFCGSKHEMDEYHADGYSVYGAIWTEKGLIYVAKMNEKGEFELL